MLAQISPIPQTDQVKTRHSKDNALAENTSSLQPCAWHPSDTENIDKKIINGRIQIEAKG